MLQVENKPKTKYKRLEVLIRVYVMDSNLKKSPIQNISLLDGKPLKLNYHIWMTWFLDVELVTVYEIYLEFKMEIFFLL